MKKPKAAVRSRARAPRLRSSGQASNQRAKGDTGAPAPIRFSAVLQRPAPPTSAGWMFLVLPKQASARLPSRGQVTVEGTFGPAAFCTTLEPDGRGGHWVKVNRKLLKAAGAAPGDEVALEIAPVPPEREPEPSVPRELRQALASATPAAREAWLDITPAARRDWIAWIVSAKQEATRLRRIASACDMLAKGKRRPCCFDRSGMYGKSMSCPVAQD